MDVGATAVSTRDGLQALLATLQQRGYRTLGPRLRDGAIGYGDITSVADLPRGWSEEQDAGRYRLVQRDDDALFGYAVGPDTWKRFFHPPVETLWRSRHADGEVQVIAEPEPTERLALIGVRACELNAIAIQDRVLLGGAYPDARYRARRDAAFIVAVNCGKAGGSCFCVSMDAGPRATTGFDLALTELMGSGGHRFLIETGSAAGAEVLAELPHRAAAAEEIAAARALVEATAAAMGRSLEAGDLRELLLANLEHPRWDEVAGRCLSCANCTMVCPTCFCTGVADSSALDGTETARTQRWDSCFTADFSYLHGGSVRASTRSRYRQWLTHKLATWHDQFDSSGCVGCGRCITWCPVGIDLTEEVAAIRAAPPRDR
jgi:ferredoxin